MSLRVWLPLNGSLENKGLSDINLTGSPIYATGGKIGNQCLASQLGWFEIPDMAGKKQMSFAYWVKINTATSTNWLDTFSWYSTDGSTNHRSRQEFYTNSTQTGVWFQGGSIGTVFKNTVGDWNHYVFTIDYDKGEAKFYINGEELANPILTVDTTHYIKGIGSAFLLRESALDSHINDFRLYDHILSPFEVKQISQGLVLHYPLNHGGLGQENLLKNTNVSVTNGSKTGFVLSQTIPSGTKVTFSLQIDAIDLVLSGSKRIGLEGFQNNGTNNSYKGVWITGANAQGTYSKRIFATVTLDRDFLINNNTFGIYVQTVFSGSVTISNPKIEIGDKSTPWCPNEADALATTMGLNDTIEYDCSGYGNNGTKIGTLDYSSDTPRYNVSTVFPTGNNYINAGRGAMVKDAITVNLWVNYSTWGNPISCTEGGGFNFESNGNLRFIQYISGIGYKVAQSTITPASLTNAWHMFTGTCDKENIYLYIDGELKGTGEVESTNAFGYNANNAIMIGAEANNSSTTVASASFIGKISDVRIYATALSPEDVLNLYNLSAAIDTNNNLYGVMLEEG